MPCINSYFSFNPRIITIASASDGSSSSSWEAAFERGSFSKYFLYSDHVVAAIVQLAARERDLSRFAASPVPADRPRRSACALRR